GEPTRMLWRSSILPALRADWGLNGNKNSSEKIIQVAQSLASRFDAKISAIRSWDQVINKRYSVF
ncbi:hypothetical protein BJ878DRAFT_519111, partial [Calycina marina]